MPEALDNGSQPYRNALGCFEMAGKSDTPTRNLAASYDFIQTYLVNIFKFCCKVSIYSSLHSDVLMVLLIIRVIFDK